MKLKLILFTILLLSSFLFVYKLDTIKTSIKKIAVNTSITNTENTTKNYEKGKTYYDQKKYKKAAYWWKKSAEQGNALVQSNLAAMYAFGMGVPENHKQAVYWWRKSAEQGNAMAQANLAVMYYQGAGVSQNHEKAVYWYKKSAEQGNAMAQSNLGAMYEEGEGGLSKDYKQAFYWHKKAALQDHPVAQYSLGMMYLEGKGVPRSLTFAYSWFNQGQSHNYSPSLNQAAYLESIMTSEEIIEAQLHALEVVKQIEDKISKKK